MQNKIRNTLAAVLLLALVAGCGKKPAATSPAAPDQNSQAQPAATNSSSAMDTNSPLYGWLKYAGPDQQFTVMFPAAPVQKQMSQQSSQGEIQVHIYASEDNAHNGYSVACYDFPSAHDDPKALLAKIEEGMIKGQAAVVNGDKPIQFGDYSGTEFTFTSNGQANFSGKCRLILVGQRVYGLSMVYLTEGPQPAASDAFFDSLSILQH